MLVLHILCHNLVGYESSRGLGNKLAECGYATSKSGYERSMGTKRLDTRFYDTESLRLAVSSWL